MDADERVNVAVVGCGYWGRNHVRAFAAESQARVVYVCDSDTAAREKATALAPGAQPIASSDAVFGSVEVDAVVLATPAVSHAELACRALAAGKHVLVEKPLALSVTDAQRVEAAAAKADRVLMVGHLMLFHPVMLRLRDMLSSGELGDLFYLHATRVNLGRLRRDESALWSFAPHDISMVDFLLGGRLPISVAARGQSYLQDGVEDVVFLNLKFSGGEMANIHLSWLNPRKERRFTLVCSKKMVEFDDVSAEKLRIYDKGYDRPPEFSHFDEYLTIRHGDVHIPHVPMVEPLAAEARHFLDCIQSGSVPRADAASAVRSVRVLEAAQRSLEAGGSPVGLKSK